MKLLFIEWTDAIGTSEGWDDRMKLESYRGNCYACGIVIDEDEDFILLAVSVTADMETNQGAMSIPKQMIEKSWEIELP